jgi:hypothetical protein
METIESKVLELTESICHLHFHDKIDAFTAIDKLNKQGFPHVSAEFVETIREQLINETDESKTVSYTDISTL